MDTNNDAELLRRRIERRLHHARSAAGKPQRSHPGDVTNEISSIPATCHLSGVIARDAPVAVLLRRGPQKWVQSILWHTDTDNFEAGQWLRAGVDACSLSPDGRLFAYYASDYRRPRRHRHKTVIYSEHYTAISRPPYFTALAIWPSAGWTDGGGVFASNDTFLLNERRFAGERGEAARQAQNTHEADGHLTVRAGADVPGYRWGRGIPVWAEIRQNLGWYRLQVGATVYWEKQSPDGRFTLVETTTVSAPEWKRYYTLLDTQRKRSTVLTPEWAEWDQRGRVLWTYRGQVFAAMPDTALVDVPPLADFSAARPEPVVPPEWATRWPDDV